MIHLFCYYYFINNKISNNDNIYNELSPNEYYLVNEKWINDIKDSYNYKKINELFNSKIEVVNILENLKNDSSDFNIKLKNVYSIIQCFKNNTFENINTNNIKNGEYYNDINALISKINYLDN